MLTRFEHSNVQDVLVQQVIALNSSNWFADYSPMQRNLRAAKYDASKSSSLKLPTKCSKAKAEFSRHLVTVLNQNKSAATPILKKYRPDHFKYISQMNNQLIQKASAGESDETIKNRFNQYLEEYRYIEEATHKKLKCNAVADFQKYKYQLEAQIARVNQVILNTIEIAQHGLQFVRDVYHFLCESF